MKLKCLLILPLFVATEIFASGYGKAIWGMSEQEVLIAEKSRIIKLETPNSYSNSVELLRIENLNISRKSCYAVFLFDDDTKKLIQVSIKFPNESDNSSNLFSSLEELLSQKYGNPFYKSKERITESGTHTVSWLSEGTKVTLTLLFIPQLVTKVRVTYQLAEDVGTSDL